jgi:hypothetical protein
VKPVDGLFVGAAIGCAIGVALCVISATATGFTSRVRTADGKWLGRRCEVMVPMPDSDSRNDGYWVCDSWAKTE